MTPTRIALVLAGEVPVGSKVTVEGWIRTRRDSKAGLSFLAIHDGSCFDALQVVMADIEKRGITRMLCLGDIIGYGPNPCECLDVVMERCEWSLMGNHDFAVLFEPTSFNASAVCVGAMT